MDRERADAWLGAYRRAWEEADPRAIPGMFTQEASYRAHPLGMAHTGQEAIADYWTRATAGQQDVQVRFGDPIVDGDRVAAEFWTTMGGDAGPVTVAGCLLLALVPGGRCRSLRECWHETGTLLAPPPDWGRLGRDAGGAGAGHGRRWAEGYERAWRAGEPEAAAALYAPTPTTAPRRSATPTWVATASSPTPAAPTPPKPPRTPASAPRSCPGPVPRPRSSGGRPCWRRTGRPP
jgi:hypothetical protein